MIIRFIFLLRRYKTISELMLNEQIRDKEIRLIGDDGEQLGIMSPDEALKIADEIGDELIEMQVRCVMVERVRNHRRALKIGYSLPF